MPTRTPVAPPPVFHPTRCCALGHITVSNETPIEQIQLTISRLQRDALRSFTPADQGGQRSAFVIVSPGENQLRRNLIDLQFKQVCNLPRRNGYPKGLLEMWVLSW